MPRYWLYGRKSPELAPFILLLLLGLVNGLVIPARRLEIKLVCYNNLIYDGRGSGSEGYLVFALMKLYGRISPIIISVNIMRYPAGGELPAV